MPALMMTAHRREKMTTNILSQKAVIADVVIRRWTGRKLDRQVTDEVNSERNAEADAGRYNKLLISKDAFREVHRLTSTARQRHYHYTLPWSDAGFRILPTAKFDEFANEFRTLRGEFEAAAVIFDKKYPDYVAGAKKRLGKMFNADDYPANARIRTMFSFKVSIRPCPDANDFRVSLGKEQLQDIKSGLEQEMQAALQEAMREPVRRIIDVVEKMAGKLKAYKPATDTDRAENTFRDSLVDNVRELVPLLSAFNLTGDKDLAKIATRMDKELCKSDADVLREDEATRKKVAKAAEEILKQANALMA
jgi:hypothetical protein